MQQSGPMVAIRLHDGFRGVRKVGDPHHFTQKVHSLRATADANKTTLASRNIAIFLIR